MKMMRKIIVVVIALLIQLGCSTQSSIFPVTPVDVYLNELVDYMEANHVNKANINWTEFRANVQQHGKSAAKIADTKETIEYAFELLDDQTSFLITSFGQVLSYGAECSDVDPGEVTGKTEIGYIKIPPFAGTGVSAAVFAEKMHGEIRDQDKAEIKGWVVDLRKNTGGNMWPMITGIGPLLGNGTAGYFVDSDGTQTSFGYSSGSAIYNNEPVITVTKPYSSPLLDGAKIAVLVDQSTTNAAEVVMIAFSGRSQTRTFGSATCGRASGNQTFTLSDRSVLYLTTSFLLDRNQVNKQGSLVPDEIASDPSLVFDQAVNWINN